MPLSPERIASEKRFSETLKRLKDKGWEGHTELSPETEKAIEDALALYDEPRSLADIPLSQHRE